MRLVAISPPLPKKIKPFAEFQFVVIERRTMVPIRAIIDAMGGTVEWFEEDKHLEVTLKSKRMKFWIDRSTAYVGDTEYTLDIPPKAINGRTMLPLRFVSENLGCKVEWDGDNEMITLLYSK